MIRFALLGLLLAGCPKKSGTTTQQAGAGCPTAAGVYVASFVTQDPGKGRSGWVVPLHASKLDGDAEDYVNIDAAAATAAGVPAAPAGAVWLATAAGQPCRATIGKHYAAKIAGPPASVTYGVELEGCPTPANLEEGGGIVLVSEQPPTGCRFEVPRPVAARLGETDGKKQWQPPKQGTPLPAPLAATIGEKACESPACEKLWAVAEVKLGGKTVAWTGAVNWLRIGSGEPCKWQAERESGVWIPDGDRAVKVTEGQEHPLPLSAVLADGGGAKVLLADGPGDYATYDLAPGRVVLGHRITWQLVPQEAWDAVDHLGPFCEPVKP